MLAESGMNNRPLKRKVAIRRDGEEFVISLQPEDLIVFRHAEAGAEAEGRCRRSLRSAPRAGSACLIYWRSGIAAEPPGS